MIVAAWATAMATRWAVGKVLNYIRPQPPQIVVQAPSTDSSIFEVDRTSSNEEDIERERDSVFPF